MSWRRRDILAAAARTLGFGVLAGVVQTLLRQRVPRHPLAGGRGAELAGLLRPPGALPESDFLGACIRCDRCQDACEPGAIRVLRTRRPAVYGEVLS